ncbi:hypothetical protein GCM10011487_19790 [Steroidobacter agaridevorans]|uniref:Uncharacterized protein n=1 Tax=Steroidobacter agaridevorans TaxID=2695856 RepID=A0A829Y9I4_9GAMM|nr:hypothetical protein [Steroidobacter agaridevorans]GFE79979.1 hypothetical protein GCM10011487_19790 [Steroidobacter agaridevorans]
MHEVSRRELIGELAYMQQHGTSLSMLIITVRNTSNGLLAGIVGGVFSLDYPIAGWLDFRRTQRFNAFCKRQGFSTCRQKWGSERVIRAEIGMNPASAADAIDACFSAVFMESGSFGLVLRQFGWSKQAEA